MEQLASALRELIDVASMVENSTDRAHWERLYRAIDTAERVLADELEERFPPREDDDG